MTDYTDELFALRLALQDSIFDEKRIIRELKLFLLERNVDINTIDQVIIDFYKKYNIDFSEEFVASVSIPQITFNPNTINNLLAPLQILNQIQNINNSLDVSDNVEDDIDSDDEVLDDDDSDDEISDDEVIDNDNDDEIIEEANSNDGTSLQVPPLMIPFPPNVAPNNQMLSAIGNLLNNNYSGNLPPAPPNHQANLINALNQLLNIGNLAPPPMEDVKATLDDSDMDTLEVKTAEEDLDITCSISMTKIKKGDKYVTLPCEHTFQESCIRTWLKEYNYKCPVCRKECGKPKYDI